MKKEEVVDVLPKTETLYTKLWKAKQEIGKVTKGSNNPFFKSKYADLNALLEATEPILLKHGLIVLQPIVNAVVCVHRIIDALTMESMVESSLALPIVSDPQKQIAGVTYFRRASLQSLLSMQAIDLDGNDIAVAVKETKTFPQDRFEAGLTKIQQGEITVDQFKKAIQGYELTELQTKAMLLL
jgi:hypothetical protein